MGSLNQALDKMIPSKIARKEGGSEAKGAKGDQRRDAKGTKEKKELNLECFRCGVVHPKDQHIRSSHQAPASTGTNSGKHPMRKPLRPPQREEDEENEMVDFIDHDEHDDSQEDYRKELGSITRRLHKRKHIPQADEEEFDSEAMEAGIGDIDEEEAISSLHARQDEEKEELYLRRQREKARARKKIIDDDDDD
eukprot:TRINITY_DN12388_c0_g3_i2.p1 TRINITY_DN12388_c0_g3~~TRINITY_DN12388_c0_g3_i2.p1  ORF type:complete len:194 (+),score=52.01 TRINITY_DN12388_c0_g3_i2:98-679(+)